MDLGPQVSRKLRYLSSDVQTTEMEPRIEPPMTVAKYGQIQRKAEGNSHLMST